ncbi:TcfC E-set like domain-containing protein [Microbulbifer aggregans]|uniref:TcfC E-set like domain-containing protein n=1 Tax=Microbulbifer aggregans TaxID=1769779 RepID=UPI001D05B2AA|nr:TcfC E-set like domain-containing protein [Microbulbifer aggregans]
MSPSDIGLIYDENRFRIDLFIAPHLLPQRAAIEDRYLPESSSEFSFIQNLTGSWSGVQSETGPDSEAFSLYGQSILSFGESGLHSQWTVGDQDDGQIYELHWTRDYRGRAYSAGLIQPLNGFSSFTASPYLYGVEYRSSNNSRADNRYQQGAPLEVNMPLRGRVEVRRDGRLLHSELLEAGNQLLDTSSLPGGAYEVEIRTLDESGRVLAEYTEFFAKDSLLPAPGEWRWSVQAGQPALLNPAEILPEAADDMFFQAGVAHRVLDNAGLFTNVAATNHSQLLEVGARWVTPYLELSPSLLETDGGRSGYRLYAALKTPWFQLSANESRLDDEDTVPEADSYALLNRGFFQRNASLTAPLIGGQLALRYSERDRGVSLSRPEFTLDDEETAAEHLTTIEYRRNLFRARNWLGELTLAHSDADGQQLTTASFQMRLRSGRWNHSARLRSDTGNTDIDGLRAGFDSSWNDRDLWALELDQQFSAETDQDGHYLRSNTRLAGHRGFASSTVQYLNNGQQEALNYLGSFSTNLMTNGDSFAWGGERPYDSAVMVNIDGSADQDFEILVNGVRRGYAKGGGQSLINLPSFGSYEVALRPLEEGFYDYSEQSEVLTLYPGNVANTEYDIQPLILALGRIVRDDSPVAHAKISIGEYSAVTDDMGVFQMEMRGDPRRLQVPPVRWGNCRVALPEQSAGEHWVNLGVIDLATAQCAAEGVGHAGR